MPRPPTKPDINLAKARLAAARKWPHATSAILSLIPVPRPGLGTAAVDMRGRIYFDPDFLKSCPPAEQVGVILHEVSHLLLRHHDRGKSLAREMLPLWNVAADLAINHTLEQDKIDLPKGGMFPRLFKLQGGQSAEWYYRELLKQQQEQANGQGKQTKPAGGKQAPGDGQPAAGQKPPAPQPGQAPGQPGSPAAPDAGGAEPGEGDTAAEAPETWEPVAPGTSGSCSDGQPRPWEAPEPTGDDAADEAAGIPPGLPEHVQDQIIRGVAEALKQRGTRPGNIWAGFVEEVLNPKVDPRTLLMRAVRRGIQQTSGGSDDWTWRRPSRRQSPGGLLRPSPVQIVPRITILLDTSGSMGRDDIGLAAGLIAKVISGLKLRDGVRVIVGDTCAQKASQVFDPRKIEVVGRGGTDVGAIINHADEEEPRPDLIIACTDGHTPWPRTPTRAKVVACLTQDSQKRSVPDWIQTVVLAQ